jgi:hypothetical protein
MGVIVSLRAIHPAQPLVQTLRAGSEFAAALTQMHLGIDMADALNPK